MFEISTIQSEAVTVYNSTDNKMRAGNEFLHYGTNINEKKLIKVC